MREHRVSCTLHCRQAILRFTLGAPVTINDQVRDLWRNDEDIQIIVLLDIVLAALFLSES